MGSIHNLTVSTRLDKRSCGELIRYFQAWRKEYGRIFRYAWYHYARLPIRPKKAAFNTELQKTFGITKRTANSIIYDVSGRYNALVELKKKEQYQLSVKIGSVEEEIRKLCEEVSLAARLAADNRLSREELSKYRGNKRSLHYKRQRLNKLKCRLLQLDKDIQAGRYRICFGSRKRFAAQNRLAENGYRSSKAWYRDFTEHRDSGISYLGAKDETCCNQMLQLTRQVDGSYGIQCRKDGAYVSGKEDRYVFGNCRFSYLDDKLRNQLLQKDHGLTCRIRFAGKKVYLQVILSFEENPVPTTTLLEGAIGLDYNDGFIQAAETDRAGNLVGYKRYELTYHGTGRKAENEIRQTIAAISRSALMAGKSIVCENLDFVKSKSQQNKGKGRKGKQYHRMTHLLDYSRYKETLKNAAVRNGIGLVLVNPAYTPVFPELLHQLII